MKRRNHDAADLFALRCSECGRQLTKTHSGFLACPAGHGKLVNDTDTGPDEDAAIDAALFEALWTTVGRVD